MGTAHREGGRSIRDEEIEPAGVAKVSETGKGSMHTPVGETGKFDKNGIPRGVPPSGADMENCGVNTKRGRGVQMDRVIGSYQEDLCIHHEKPTMLLHHTA